MTVKIHENMTNFKEITENIKLKKYFAMLKCFR